MITIKSDKEIDQYLDKPSRIYLIEQMKKDCLEFSKTTDFKENEWIAKVIVLTGSDHEGSKIPLGLLLRYQFKQIAIGYDMGIREVKIPESTDEFLDLMNEVRKNPEVFNVVYNGK